MAVAIIALLAIPALAVAIWLFLVGPWCVLMYAGGAWSREEAWKAFRSAPEGCLQIAGDVVNGGMQ